jgi:hypothetical protein
MVASLPVPGLIRNDPTDAATGIENVATTSGNDMDVGMEDGLASGFAVIQANVEAIRMQIILEPLPGLSDQCPQSGLSVSRKLVDAGNVLLRDHQCVALRDRECVPQNDSDVTFEPNPDGIRHTEWA